MEKTAIRFLGHYVKVFKWAIFALLGCVVVRQFANTVEPYFMSKIYTAVAENPDSSSFLGKITCYATIMALVSLVSILIAESSMFIIARYLPKIRTMVIRDTFEYVNRQSISYFSNEMTGNISHKVQILANNTTEFINFSYEILHMICRLVSTIGVLLWVSVYYLAFFVIWLTLLVCVSEKLGKLRHFWGKETGRLSSKANGMIVDAISNYSEIKSFANFKFEKINLLKSLRQLRKAETSEKKIMGYIRMAQQLMSVFSIIGFLFFSIYLLKINQIDNSQFIFVNTLFLNISFMSFNMSWMYNNVSRMLGDITSALETLATEPEIVDSPNAVDIKLHTASISLKNVNFGYKDNNKLFENLNLEIKAREKVGLVGLSGSGKSTFIKLISRYYDVDSGSICINGTDIRDITQESLHRNIATIPQDVCLFNRSLMENIRYGDTEADDEQVKEAAHKAYADIFIEKFVDGYQTTVGDRGVILSGGERQRIAIARAILKNAPLLIFDEATSALDSQSELHIQKSLQNLMAGKTVLAIAHRLSTLREMDRILVFDKGKIIEDGNHQQLLAQNGFYARLYKMQVAGFMGEAKA